MIRKIKISIPFYLTNWTPCKKALTDRLKLLSLLFTGASELVDDYHAFRDNAITRANVTGETGSLEWWLNELFDTTLRRIEIETASFDGLPMGIRGTEPTFKQSMGIRTTEPTFYKGMRQRGENTLNTNKSFIVSIPAALSSSAEAIEVEVRKYKLGGKTFEIVTV